MDNSKDGVFEQQVLAAVDWLTQAICHAHESKALKAVASQLLAVRVFTTNLNWAKESFKKILRPRLQEELAKRGAELGVSYNDLELQWHLSDDAVFTAVGHPHDHPLRKQAVSAGRTEATQIDVFPADTTGIWMNYDKPVLYSEEAYAHALLMVAAVLDKSFQEAVERVVSAHNTHATAATTKHHKAPPKTIARVMTKAKSDYRGRPRPVSQNNIDVVRCLVQVDTHTELLQVAAAVAVEFGGVVKVKNCFSADKQQREERDNLLPLMLTVCFTSGPTFAEWLGRDDTQIGIASYIDKRNPGISESCWAAATESAVAMLHSDQFRHVPVRILAEVQLMLAHQHRVRGNMHFIYKVSRAESDRLLFDDFSIPSDEHVGDPRNLWEAAAFGNIDAVRHYLDACRTVDAIDDTAVDPQTPLWVAARNGHTNVVDFLATAGAAIEYAPGASGLRPLRIAAEHGHTSVVQCLVNHGASISDASANDARPPLLIAAEHGHLAVVRALLDVCADVDQVRTGTGITPLIAACREGHVDVVHTLLEHGAVVNRQTTKSGITPLWTAANNGHDGIVRMLIQHSADVDVAQSSGRTPLYAAAYHGYVDIVSQLLDAGADVDKARTDDGCGPLHTAAFSGFEDVVDLLIQKNATVNATDRREEKTPLHTAVARGHIGVAKRLLGAGADVNRAGKQSGNTPIHEAARSGLAVSDEICRMLVAAGGNVCARNHENKVPFDV